jgi:chemotaxis protein methyltransferase WspC
MAALLRRIEEMLASRIGLDPVAIGGELIARAVRQRMSELGLGDLSAYERRARQSEVELQALIEEVVVSESWFFRDQRPFEWLGQYVRTRWLAEPVRPPFRVLSMPCAGGEEPYSIAMMLCDLGLPRGRFGIDAVDVSAHRLAVARRGTYSRNAFRGPELAFRARYFREHQGGYELDSSIRASVRFVQASVLDPKLLEGSPPYDVLFCRNLLIYLSTEARSSVVAVIDRLLAPDGILFLGHADRLDSSDAGSRFAAVGDPGSFVYRRAASGNTSLPQGQLERSQPVSDAFAPDRKLCGEVIGSPTVIAGPAARRGLGTPDDAGPISFAGEPAARLEEATALANQGRFDEAVRVCERHLAQQGLSAAAYYLLGTIHQAVGDGRRAEDCFHKTVYLDPGHDEALLALALLAERRGDNRAAARFRRRAQRALALSGKRVI